MATHKERTRTVIRLHGKKAADLRPRSEGYEIRDEVVPGLILRVGKKGDESLGGRGPNRAQVAQANRLETFPTLSAKEASTVAEAPKEVTARPVRMRGVHTVADLFERYAAARAPKMRAWRDVQLA